MLTLTDFTAYFDGVTKTGTNQFMAKCPCHNDNKASLAIGLGRNGNILLHCQAGCDKQDILNKVGVSFRDITAEKTSSTKSIVATYKYPSGVEKVRFSDKSFSWRKPDEKGGYIWNRQGMPHELYIAGSPEDTVYIVEGEKDANNLAGLGFYCVSSENGAGNNGNGKKWYVEYNATLEGKTVYILPDNDEIGRSFAESVQKEIRPVAKSVCILDLKIVWAEIPDKGDISDMIQTLGNEETIKRLETLRTKNEDSAKSEIFAGFYTVSSLTEDEKKPPEFIVQGIIPVGLSILAGRPKIRKSYFALQMAQSVAKGVTFLGHETTCCDVVYFDLEGSKSRISARSEQMGSIPDNVFITNNTDYKIADGKMCSAIQSLHKERPSIRLFIIDTFSRARGSRRASGANAYDEDVALLEPLQRMAINENIAVLCVTHFKKGASDLTDSFEMINGTTGISGSADSVLLLSNNGARFEGRAQIEITPRDAKGCEMELFFDDMTGQWRDISSERSNPLTDSVCKWIIDNAPERAIAGVFVSYADVASEAFNGRYIADPSGTVRDSVSTYKKILFEDYGIAVQLGVKNSGSRGIRIVKC